MKRNTVIYTAITAVLAAAALGWAFAPRPIPVELAAVTRGRFEQTIDEDAKTRLSDRYQVSAPLTGRLARISLREGDPVAADSVVATLTPMLPAMLDERSLREFQARVEGAQAAIESAGARIERARVTLAQARQEVTRTEQLAQGGFVSAIKLDTDRLTVQAAQKEVDAAVAQRHVAIHDLEQARAALGAVTAPAVTAPQKSAARAGPANISGASFTVRAPVSGRVLRLLQVSEGTVTIGTPLLEIGDVARLEIVAELLTTDALAAVPGSPVVIERWGGAGNLAGRVTRVEPAAFTKISALGVEEQRVRVLIGIDSPPEQWKSLGDGFRVSVRIVTVAQPDVLLVPVSAVFPLSDDASASSAAASGSAGGTAAGAHDRADDKRFAVFVLQDGRARLTPVAIGGRNGSVAWIRSGLAADQKVVVYPPNTLRDGLRIAPRST